MLSLLALGLFHVVTWLGPPQLWPGGQVKIFMDTLSGLTTSTNTTTSNTATTPFYTDMEEMLGCNVAKFAWCTAIRPPPSWFYFTSFVLLIGIGFPSVNVTLITIFSRILGPRRQGTEQGVLQMSGSAARLLGPVLIASLFVDHGPMVVWLAEIGIVALTLLLWLVFYPRMVPLEERWKEETRDKRTEASPTGRTNSGFSVSIEEELYPN